MLRTVKINNSNLEFLKEFLETAGISLKTFRYYNKHPLSIIKNHLVTYMIMNNNSPICYGHLDKEKEQIWLGIAVTEEYCSKGLGKMMMNKLINYAKRHQVNKIFLSVDNDNLRAINLYKKFNFVEEDKKDKNTIYSLEFRNDKR